jgi:uncharacterized RDD family membrane protein YckC
VTAIDTRPMASFFTGVLAFILLGPLVFLLVVSVAGILVIPFLACALVAAVLFGKAAVYRFAGEQLVRQVTALANASPLVSLLIGGMMFGLVYCIPYIGFLAWGSLFPLAVGAALLAAFEGFRREPPASVPVTGFAGTGVPPIQPPPPLTATGLAVGIGAGAAGVAGTAMSGPPALAATLEETSYPRAGFWRRLIATFLDVFLVAWLVPVVGPFAILFWAAYHIAMWTWKGTTIGGIVLGLKVVRLDGRPVDFATALVRGLSAFFSAMVFLLGFFWAGWDREKQSWHDKIAGTVIVRVPRGVSLV